MSAYVCLQADLEAAKEAQRLETAKLLIDTFTNHVDLSSLVQVRRRETSLTQQHGQVTLLFSLSCQYRMLIITVRQQQLQLNNNSNSSHSQVSVALLLLFLQQPLQPQ